MKDQEHSVSTLNTITDDNILTNDYLNDKIQYLEKKIDLLNLEQNLEELNKKKDLLKKQAIIESYNNIANQHNRNANYFRLSTILFLLISICILAITIINYPTDLSFYSIVNRIIIGVIVSSPSIYTARESSKHANMANKYISIILQLQYLDIYTEDLEIQEKNKLKQELASKYFTGALEDNKEEKNDTLVDQMEKLIKAFSPLINKEKDK